MRFRVSDPYVQHLVGGAWWSGLLCLRLRNAATDGQQKTKEYQFRYFHCCSLEILLSDSLVPRTQSRLLYGPMSDSFTVPIPYMRLTWQTTGKRKSLPVPEVMSRYCQLNFLKRLNINTDKNRSTFGQRLISDHF